MGKEDNLKENKCSVKERRERPGVRGGTRESPGQTKRQGPYRYPCLDLNADVSASITASTLPTLPLDMLLTGPKVLLYLTVLIIPSGESLP